MLTQTTSEDYCRAAHRFHYMWPFLLSLVLTGCPSAEIRKPIDTSKMTVDQVGTVRVGVVSVAPWLSYADVLQPHFDMDPEKALQQAIPTTRLQALSNISKNTAKIGVGLQSKTKTIEETTTNGETETKETKNRKAGDIPEVNVPNVSDTQAAATILQKIEEKPDVLGLEPRLQYQTATSLYQEVQLLNRYILDVAQREAYTPYLVRLQVTLMPRRRNLPLDAYVNLTFFASNGSNNSELRKTIVAPLIATDSHENTLASQTAQAIRELGASLKSIRQTGVGVDVGNLSQSLEDLVGRDINSTFGVARLSDNTIRVRIGALQQGSNNLVMVPRTESVTVLLMVPNEVAKGEHGVNRLIHVTTLSQLINTNTGKRLNNKDNKQEDHDVKELTDFYFPSQLSNTNELTDNIDRWWGYVLENNVSDFNSEINNYVCKEQTPPAGVNRVASDGTSSEFADYCDDGNFIYREELWAELAGLQTGYIVDTQRFEVPRVAEPTLFPRQSVVLDDDGRRFSYARVYYGTGLTSSDLCGNLRIRSPDTEVGDNANGYVLAAQDISVDSGGREAVLRFDSLAALNLAPQEDDNHATLELRIAKGATHADCWGKLLEKTSPDLFKSFGVRYRLNATALAEGAGFTVSPSTGYLVGARDGSSELVLVIDPDKVTPAQEVTVDIRGANIVSANVEHKSIERLGTRVKLNLGRPPKRRDLVLKLGGVLSGEVVTVESWNQVGAMQKQIQLQVRNAK